MSAIGHETASPARWDRIQVWDAPTRLFHWGMAALVLIAWLTGEGEGVAADIHRYAGEALAGLLVFRLIWGVVGGEHARFSAFLKHPGRVSDHGRELLRGRVRQSLGHNPLGALSVVVLLLSVVAVVVTGLFSAGEEGPGGPLAGRFGLEMSELHEPAFRVLQVLVVLHLIGVAVTSLASRENLLGAMITGTKRRRLEERALHARPASALALIIAAAIGAGAGAWLMTLPHPARLGEAGEAKESSGRVAPAEGSETDEDG